MRTSHRTRNLIGSFSAILLALSASADGASSDMLIDKHRLKSRVARLETTLQSTSGHATELAQRNALRQLARYLQDAGMMTHTDASGNLIGRLAGKHAWPALVVGSRINMATAQDNDAGLAGVVSAVEIAQALHDNGTVLDHPLEIIIWAMDAGSMRGNHSVNEIVAPDEISATGQVSAAIAEGIALPDGYRHELALKQRAAGKIAAYLEIQVGLDEALQPGNADLGILQRFTAVQHWNIWLASDPSDATTAQQQQLVDAASQFLAAVVDSAPAEPAIGNAGPTPTSSITIQNAAADTQFILDLRAQELDAADRLFVTVRGHADRIGRETGTRFVMQQTLALPAKDSDQLVPATIAKAASQLQLSYTPLRGAAGVDAHDLSALVPVGVIVVPGGLQYGDSRVNAPLPDALANGANTLLRTLLELDKLPQERSR